MKSSKVISLLLLGVAAGILIAPDKGAETRRKLSKSINDLGDYIKDIIESTRSEINEWADEEVDNIDNLKSQAEDILAV